MRITIIRNDNIVIIDGQPKIINLANLSSFIHAIQWYGEYGIMEVVDNDSDIDNDIIDNVRIESFDDYEWIITDYYAVAAGQYDDIDDENDDPNIKEIDDSGEPDTNPE
jgi:hypothetical protein